MSISYKTLLLISLLFIYGLTSPPSIFARDISVEYQSQIDRIGEMQAKAFVPQNEEELFKLKASYDVNDYFRVLTHLSMEKGFRLDYFYHIDGLGSYPLLFAIKEYSCEESEICKCSWHQSDSPESEIYNDYLYYVRTDGSDEGSFQLIILNLLASRFALGWHANYNDTEIVCTKEAVERILNRKADFFYQFDEETLAKARQIDPEPHVTATKEGSIVRVVFFTKWGGFIERVYGISMDFPHRIRQESERVLAQYNCGVMF